MLYETLQILKEQLERYFFESGFSNTKVELGNVALFDGSNESGEIAALSDKVIISVIRLEEESALKNFSHVKINEMTSEYRNPPVNLNIYLLVAANFSSYTTSLRSISKVIEFFQGKKVFTAVNTIYDRDNVEFDFFDNFRFIIELYSPGFEELNNIWGILGGKQILSVIYKLQLIQIESSKKLSTTRVITHLDGTLNE